jgi:hypothetical protein
MCEHGGLALNISNRIRISHQVGQRLLIRPRGYTYDSQAFVLLKTLFPLWVTLSDTVAPCAVCDTLAENSREDKRELRRKAEEEKVGGPLALPTSFADLSCRRNSNICRKMR